jgi:uncharacterized protein YkwD
MPIDLRPALYVPLITILLTTTLTITACSGGGGSNNTQPAPENTGYGSSTPPEESSTTTTQPDTVNGDCVLSAEDIALLDAHNQARAMPRQCGETAYSAAPPLVWSCTLATAGVNHSTDMADVNFFNHIGSDGLDPFDRITNLGYGYRAAAENIAAGQPSVETVVAGWLGSTGHCKNIMNANLTQMGGARVGSNTAQYSNYWTVVFGKPR